MRGSPGAGPSFFYDLLTASDGQCIIRHIACDARCSADVSAFTHSYRSDQSAVAADEGAVFNHGCILSEPIKVAGNRSGADVDAGANLGVSQVSQMVDLR